MLQHWGESTKDRKVERMIKAANIIFTHDGLPKGQSR